MPGDDEALYTAAAMRIGGYESFGQNAYWDVNAWRLGYGSDTEGQDQFKVQRGMSTTEWAAEANLRLRIKEFEKVVVGQVGRDAWDGLTQGQKASLLSVAYNYGSLPRSVAAAVRSGDAAASGEAIRGLKANADRRKDEAQAFPTRTPPRKAGAVSPAAHFHAASVHHAVRSALALGPGTYGATHRHKHST